MPAACKCSHLQPAADATGVGLAHMGKKLRRTLQEASAWKPLSDIIVARVVDSSRDISSVRPINRQGRSSIGIMDDHQQH